MACECDRLAGGVFGLPRDNTRLIFAEDIQSGSITAATIQLGNGGVLLAGDPAGSHLQQDESGLRFYAADGTTILLEADVATGSLQLTNAAVSGTFDTSNGGTSAGILVEGHELRFFNSSGEVGSIHHSTGNLFITTPHNTDNTYISLTEVVGASSALVSDQGGWNIYGNGAEIVLFSLDGVRVWGDILWAEDGLKIGLDGDAVVERRRVTVNFNAPSVAANGGGIWDIPLPAGTTSTTAKTFFTFQEGIGNTGLVPVQAQCFAVDEVRLLVRNVTGAAVDLSARDYTFEMTIIA